MSIVKIFKLRKSLSYSCCNVHSSWSWSLTAESSSLGSSLSLLLKLGMWASLSGQPSHLVLHAMDELELSTMKRHCLLVSFPCMFSPLFWAVALLFCNLIPLFDIVVPYLCSFCKWKGTIYWGLWTVLIQICVLHTRMNTHMHLLQVSLEWLSCT